MLSRRQFAKGIGASLAMATQVPQSAPAAPAPAGQRARRTIVDAQVHLWKANSPELPWVAGVKPGQPEPFTIERVLPLMDEAGVDRIIVVPPTLTGTRNDYGLEAAKRYPGRFAVMGRFPIGNPKAADLLPRWKEQPGMLGIRVSFSEKSVQGLHDGSLDWFWAAAEKAAVPVMFLAPGHMASFDRIAERHPQLTLIVDHISMNRTIPIAQSATDTIALAKHPNVSVKMKAGAQYAPEPYPYRAMNVQLQRTFEAFGPQRCYWETDITQTLKEGGYKHRIAHFTEELPFLTEDDKDWVMGRAILARLKWA
jgi:predicted TIM-barrel fold metal-dependent hydrolase